MTYIVSITSFILLATFLVLCASKHGVPRMVSDTYYQLSAEDRWLFPLILATSAMMLMPCLLEVRPNAAAFLATAGVIFVAAAPAYLDPSGLQRHVHKAAAIIAAAGCLLWSLTACPRPTLVLACIYVLYLSLGKSDKYIFIPDRAWYWAEVACLVDIYVTYWVITA